VHQPARSVTDVGMKRAIVTIPDDLERLEVEGVPGNVSLAKSGQQNSKAG
jgi:hypothetical protein